MPPCPLAIIFGFSAALFFAAAGIPVAAAFFYKRRSNVVEVPAVDLWEQLGKPVDVQSFAALLRRILSLLAQIALLALLIFSLADPWPKPPTAGRTIIVLDLSATLQTREGAGDRFALAKQRALDALAKVGNGTDAAVILAGPTPVLAQPLSQDITAARHAIRDAVPRDVDGDLRAAIRTAAAMVDADLDCEVVVCSDFMAINPSVVETGWVLSARLTLLPVGTDEPDVAITDLWAESIPDAQGNPKAQITATLRQRGMDGRKVPVRLEVNGRALSAKDVSLNSKPTQVQFTMDDVPGAVLKVQVDGGDALAADDAGYLVLSTAVPVPVDLITAGNPTLIRVLKANTAIDLRVVDPAKFRDDSDAAVVIVDSAVIPARPPGANQARGYLFIDVADPFGWSATGKWTSVPAVTHWAGDLPIMADLDPTTLPVSRAMLVRFLGGTSRDVLCAESTPLVTALTPPPPANGQPTPRCVYWLFDSSDPQLPGRVGYPLLVWNTLDYLAGRHTDETIQHLTGQPLQIVDPVGAKILNPDGNEVTASPAATSPPSAAVYDTSRQGIYLIDRGGRREACAVNLFSSRALQPLERHAAYVPTVNRSAGLATTSWWRAPFKHLAWDSVLLTAVGLALLEWLLYHRRALQVG
jgi:hypothetical protein